MLYNFIFCLKIYPSEFIMCTNDNAIIENEPILIKSLDKFEDFIKLLEFIQEINSFNVKENIPDDGKIKTMMSLFWNWIYNIINGPFGLDKDRAMLIYLTLMDIPYNISNDIDKFKSFKNIFIFSPLLSQIFQNKEVTLRYFHNQLKTNAQTLDESEELTEEQKLIKDFQIKLHDLKILLSPIDKESVINLIRQIIEIPYKTNTASLHNIYLFIFLQFSLRNFYLEKQELKFLVDPLYKLILENLYETNYTDAIQLIQKEVTLKRKNKNTAIINDKFINDIQNALIEKFALKDKKILPIKTIKKTKSKLNLIIFINLIILLFLGSMEIFLLFPSNKRKFFSTGKKKPINKKNQTPNYLENLEVIEKNTSNL